MIFPAHGDFAKIVEVRPKRSLFCRRVNISNPNEDNPKKDISLLLVHGSCAASSQYDALVEELRKDYDHLKFRSLSIYMYDQLGCGESASSSDWNAFAST